ncbi:MAG: META domain-containing protein [Pseudomonadales bacterium]
MKYALPLIASIVALGACSSPSNDTPITAANLPLMCQQQEWQLVSMTSNGSDRALSAETRSTPSFSCDEKTRVVGMASINRYFGDLEVGADGKLNWPGPGFASTMMAGPPELMDQERDYFATLTQTSQASVKGDVLILSNSDNSQQLHFSLNHPKPAG